MSQDPSRVSLLAIMTAAAAVAAAATVVQGLECGFPGLPANGSIVGGSTGLLFYPGEEVSFRCRDGFVLFGEERRKCEDDGTWAGAMPECKLNLALGKSSLQSSTLWNYDPGLAVDADPDTCSFTPRSSELRWWQVHLGQDKEDIQSVAVTISPGSYQHFTIFVIELLEGNKALYKPCSKFDGKFESKKAVFLCNGGQGLRGQFVYVRDDREEQEYFGLCEVEVFRKNNFTQCGDPEQPLSSKVNRTASAASGDGGGDVAAYSCVKGFRLVGDGRRRCLPNGVWSGKPPKCQEVSCEHPHSVKDGFIEVSNFRGRYVYGSLATYHCNPGYILWGNASRLCAGGGRWTGSVPQCKPITCGQPPEVANAGATLVNGSTLWRSVAGYRCKPGFRREGAQTTTTTSANSSSSSQDVFSRCTQSGLWETVDLTCSFDPRAMGEQLQEGGLLEGWKTLNGDSRLSAGLVVTAAVVAASGVLAAVAVVTFFAHRKLTRETPADRKTSQTSTHQLLSEQNGGAGGGGAAAVAAAAADRTSFRTLDRRTQLNNYRGGGGGGGGGSLGYDPKESGMMYNTLDGRCHHQLRQKMDMQQHHEQLQQLHQLHQQQQHLDDTLPANQFDTFPRLHPNQQQLQQQMQQQQLSQDDTQLRTFRMAGGQQQQLLQLPRLPGSSGSTGSSSVGQRSSGDGGSAAEEEEHGMVVPPYARMRLHDDGVLREEEAAAVCAGVALDTTSSSSEEEESHYSLIRQPDGMEHQVSLNFEHRSLVNGDDAGYESLQQHQQALRLQQQQQQHHHHEGIDSIKVREKVYETLRKSDGGGDATAASGDGLMTSSSDSNNPAVGSSSSPAAPPATSIKGIRPRQLQVPTRRGCVDDDDCGSPPELPPPPHAVGDGGGGDVACLYARVDKAKKKRNRGSGTGSSSETGSTPCSPLSPTTAAADHQELSPTRSLIHKFNTLGQSHSAAIHVRSNPLQQQQQPEPLYATIGSRNRSQNASRFAPQQQQQ